MKQPATPKRTAKFSKFGFFGLTFVVIAASTSSIVWNTRHSRNQCSAIQSSDIRTSLGQFPPQTDSETELGKMLCKGEAKIDLALANWLVVVDIPQFADLPRDKYFERLNELTEQVNGAMAKMREVAKSRGKDLEAPDTRCSLFCNAIHKLNFDYATEFQHDLTPQQEFALHANADNIFFAGLMRTRRGSCVSMPLMYLVIGQRLGMPVHLVALGKHYFIRWEERGYRMNIETTITDRVAVTPDDSVYLDSEAMTKDQLRGSDLRNLTDREVIGQLFFTRSGYWAMSRAKSRRRSWMDLSRAQFLSPDDPAIQKTCQSVFTRFGITPHDTAESLKQKEGKRI